MASLFHPAGPKGSSSGASSSSTNPFQALTHFYEQELTDNHIDSAPSRHHRHQLHAHAQRTKPTSSSPAHLFPSASPSTSSSVSAQPAFANSLSPSSKDGHGEEFKNFSHATHSLAFSHPSSQSSSSGSSSRSSHSNINADLSEHLRQRQEYYLREARLRSADRHDGLGPIVDFSQDWHQHHQQPEDHIVARHYNPYAEEAGLEANPEALHFRQLWSSQPRPKFQQSRRASSQLEQVQMDFGQDTSLDMERTWQETLSAMSSSSSSSASSPSSLSLAFVPTQWRRHGPAVEGSLASSFMDAAAALPSSWPLAPWAIETEAALMEFETIYKDYGLQQQLPNGQHRPPLYRGQQPEAQQHQQAGSWSEEFAKASCEMSPSALPPRSSDRRASLKTCGFMLDPKRQSLESIESLNDISSVQARVNAVAAATAVTIPSQTLDGAAANAVVGAADLSLVDGFRPPMSVRPAMDQESSTNNLVSIERPGQSFNDDIFEGDMLQAWMDTLAQEKHDADEAKEATLSATNNSGEGEISEADRQILETAIRRLNALKHQLDSRLPPPLPPSPHFDQEA